MSQSNSAMRLATLGLLLLSLLTRVSGLYFYLEGSDRKCFIEDLPQETVVVGHYNAEEFVEETNQFVQPDGLGVHITVEEIFDNNHRVVSQRNAAQGTFTFTAADSGEHRICFQANSGNAGWFSRHTIRMHLDISFGDASMLSKDPRQTEKLSTLVEKVQELNHRLSDIKREQIFQREREAEFRDKSEATNARVVRWSIIQLFVIGATCAWQLHHLRGFFVKQKLV
ncbi:emp24/gp25L/p24 family/GOLD-domain-containing protein [Lipomyces oligophaga]|uniref:emp24/gp25L/p24 family/GOLD-domain-containing protein n=1 Tax=Lipomyces oligophaga TaxID=45792 RepID=UPI0034D00C3B